MKAGTIRAGMMFMMIAGVWLLVSSERVSAESGPAQIQNGKKVYAKYCAGCHGAKGKGEGYKILGADPADFTSSSTKTKSDAALLNTIHEGKLTMPSWKIRLSDQDSRDVLAYIRTLAK
jgi:mono/diheme cytochrome c family protein